MYTFKFKWDLLLFDSSSCLARHKTLRFYYVNVYRTICFFFLPQHSSSSRVMMMNYWWMFFFCSASFRFVFYVFLAVRIHFCYSTFILLPSSRCRAIEICLWNHCDSHLDYDVSISDSNYEFTIFNGAVWGSAVERTDDERAQLAGKCQFSCSPQISWHQHESPEKCIYAIKYFVCCLRLRKQSTISIKSSAPAQNPESIERELQAERFFSGPSVYENGS